MKPIFLIMTCSFLVGGQTLEQLQALPIRPGEPTLGQRYATMLTAGFFTITFTTNETRTVSKYQFDRHDKTMFDRQGNPKLKWVTESVPVETTIPAQAGTLFYVNTSDDLLGTQS